MKIKMSVFIASALAIAVFFSFFYFKNNKKQEIISEKPESPAARQNEEEKFAQIHPDSIPLMSEKEYSGEDLHLEKVLDDNPAYTRYSITYKSEGLRISGIMNIPKGDGPFPVLILNHGYIDPQNYTNGQGLKREQDFFARNGYAVLHSDYRNHAFSDFDPENEIRPRSGYVEDAMNAIGAIKKSEFESLDKDNIGMLGHSMGGGVTLNVMVTKPESAKAYALLAPINSDYQVNFDKWVRSDWSETAQEFIEKYGEPEENPELWSTLSAKNYLEKITSPVMLHQGTLDDQVPVEWSRELARTLQEKEKDITYHEYPQEGHTFINAQSLVMARTLEFFDSNLK